MGGNCVIGKAVGTKQYNRGCRLSEGHYFFITKITQTSSVRWTFDGDGIRFSRDSTPIGDKYSLKVEADEVEPGQSLIKEGSVEGDSITDWLLKKYGITHRVATPYHPQTSGQVEDSLQNPDWYESVQVNGQRLKQYFDGEPSTHIVEQRGSQDFRRKRENAMNRCKNSGSSRLLLGKGFDLSDCLAEFLNGRETSMAFLGLRSSTQRNPWVEIV
nr:putative nucleotidyltransferase, Hydrolase [Ipomoea batatas]